MLMSKSQSNSMVICQENFAIDLFLKVALAIFKIKKCLLFTSFPLNEIEFVTLQILSVQCTKDVSTQTLN
jgi:hypothetical protein